jgi:hypothetical protein
MIKRLKVDSTFRDYIAFYHESGLCKGVSYDFSLNDSSIVKLYAFGKLA